MLAERTRSEEGVALVYVLLAMVIISGLVVVFMQRTLFEMRATSGAAAWESAIHVGEAGAEALFGEINVEGENFAQKVVTTDPDGNHHVYDPAGHFAPATSWTDAELRAYEREWAIALAQADWDAGGAGIIQTDDGHAFGIRPKVAGVDEAWDIVFGVGFVPSIDHPNRTVRMVKMRINRYYFAADNALLSGGSIYLSGNASILAPGCTNDTPEYCDADVHANGNFRGGGSGTIQGTLTVTGSGADSFTTTNGPGLNGEQEVPMPPVRALDFYNRPGAETEDWYDLCRNGAGDTPVVRSPGSAPCTGEQIWPAPDDPSTSFRGWTFQTQGPDGPRWTNQSIRAGVYYVHHANAVVSGAAGTNVPVTILLGSDDSAASTAEALGGSLKITGNPVLVPAIPDVQYIVDPRGPSAFPHRR
jgi:Tfp pilus assembly protein PilX